MRQRGDVAYPSAFERSSERFSRVLARRFSRRSFLGNFGKGAIVVASGGAGSVIIDARDATAHAISCQHNESISCNELTGSNSCPSETCGCGYWFVCGTAACPGIAKVWSDCCAATSSACANLCRCVNGWPRCCNHKQWDQGCGELNVTHIKCRRWYCSTAAC
jgi:hypothetical protein